MKLLTKLQEIATAKNVSPHQRMINKLEFIKTIESWPFIYEKEESKKIQAILFNTYSTCSYCIDTGKDCLKCWLTKNYLSCFKIQQWRDFKATFSLYMAITESTPPVSISRKELLREELLTAINTVIKDLKDLVASKEEEELEEEELVDYVVCDKGYDVHELLQFFDDKLPSSWRATSKDKLSNDKSEGIYICLYGGQHLIRETPDGKAG